jgi:hypothetical protein
VFDDIVPRLVPDTVIPASQPKTFNDPVWRTIELTPEEITVLNTPLMQRLRRTRQLGLANLVYPGANHTRFEHSIGAVEAADRMFNRLAQTCEMHADDARRFRRRVRMAALIHDCGHGVFSHVSERVLQQLFRTEFNAIKDVLNSEFPADHPSGKPPAINKAAPPAAELLSILFLASERFERFMTAQAWTADDLYSIAGLILGRSYDLTSAAKKREYNFIKSLISGDLDADKIDYVARDAYFCGIAIAGDVDRLLSQLCAVASNEDAGMAGGAKERLLIGVKPSGIATVEMFVMTRSYLFDRIYCHPKIRATERLVERCLLKYLGEGASAPENTSRNLKLLLTTSDDALLQIADDDLPQNAFRDIAIRNVPERVLAVSRRVMLGYKQDTGKSLPSISLLWPQAEEEFYQRGTEIENLIRNVAGLPPETVVILDWTQRNPIKEDPDIWVQSPDGDKKPERVNQHFDAERYSNAYQAVKETGWIFGYNDSRNIIAAASTLILSANFGLIPLDDAYRKAKIEPAKVLAELSSIRIRAQELGNQDIVVEIDNLLRARGDKVVIPNRWIMARCPGDWGDEEKSTFAQKLSVRISEINLPFTYLDQVDEIFPILEKVLAHRHHVLKTMSRHTLFEDEKALQKHLHMFVCADSAFVNDYIVTLEEKTASGRVDLRFQNKATHRTTVVELKVQNDAFEILLDKWAGQTLHYASDPDYNRIGIFYAQFKSDDAQKDSDLVDVRLNTQTSSSPLAAICLGLRRTSGTASQPALAKISRKTQVDAAAQSTKATTK